MLLLQKNLRISPTCLLYQILDDILYQTLRKGFCSSSSHYLARNTQKKLRWISINKDLILEYYPTIKRQLGNFAKSARDFQYLLQNCGDHQVVDCTQW